MSRGSGGVIRLPTGLILYRGNGADAGGAEPTGRKSEDRQETECSSCGRNQSRCRTWDTRHLERFQPREHAFPHRSVRSYQEDNQQGQIEQEKQLSQEKVKRAKTIFALQLLYQPLAPSTKSAGEPLLSTPRGVHAATND